MPTYFNYVEREADSYVNWADVGRDMSNTIDDIQRVREEKKALIEKTYREDLKFIQDNPSGEHETMNAWSLGVAQSSAEMMRLQNTMLKQGKLSLPNYLTFRQNITDSVEKIYTVNSQLQEAFKEVNDRTKAGDNQQLERETKVLLEKYGKLQDTEAYINPLNGTIYLGLTEIVEEDGKSVRRLKKGDGTYLSPDQLQAAAIQKFDNFDEQPVLDKWVEGLGDVKVDLREIGGETLAGLITSVTDITNETILQKAEEIKLPEAQMTKLKEFVTNFNKAETDFIEGVLRNPYNASALLTEKIKGKDGKTYNIVFNKADQKTEYDIYVDKTDSKFTPIFDDTDAGKAQKKVLFDYLQKQLRVKYDRKVEMQPYNEPRKERPPVYQPTSDQIKAGKEAKSAGTMGTYIRDLWSGDMAKKQQSLRILQGDGEVVPSGTYFKTGKGKEVFLHITRKSDGESTDIKMTNEDGTPSGDVTSFGRAAASWLYASDVSKKVLLENDAEFVSALNATPNFTQFNPSQKDEPLWDRPAEAPEKVDPFIGIGNNIDKVDIFGSIQATAASDLKTALGGLGKQLTIEKSGYSAYGVGYDRVTVTAPNGEKIVLKTGYGSGTANKDAKDKEKGRLMTWLKENVKPELE